MTDHVAVIIPARPEEPFLAEAVASVLAEPELSHLVIATHERHCPTAQWVGRQLDTRVGLVISNGPSAGENLDAGVAHTDAPWLGFLDADDTWPAGRLRAGLAAARRSPGAELVLGQQRAMTSDGELLEAIAPAPLLGAALITRAAADRIGPFGDTMVAQMRWLLRARELAIPTVALDEVVLHRRGHAGNLSRVKSAELHRAYLRLARERAASQRSAGSDS